MTRPAEFRLSLVVPAYNEARNLGPLIARISAQTAELPATEIIIVDDGSSDDTLDRLRELSRTVPTLRYVALSRNAGHQAALRAGLDTATGDCVICLDADLQHPPELISAMILRWLQGADVVNAIRQDPPSLSRFKRLTSRWYYRALNALSGLKIQAGSSDFRLLDRKVLDILVRLPETDLFFRGIIPTLGFRVAEIAYRPDERLHGTTKYTLGKMARLALTGVISTSMRPLRLASWFAFCTATVAAAFLGYVLYIALVAHQGVPGWASTTGVILVLGTMQLLVLGVIGEYLGQILKETRRRPPYHVAEASEPLSTQALPAGLATADDGSIAA